MELEGDRREPGRLTELESKLHGKERIVSGTRDNFLFAVACKLVDQGFGENEIRALIRATYLDRCDTTADPLGEQDFERIAHSAMRYEKAAKTNVPSKLASVASVAGYWNPSDEATAVGASDFLATNTAPTDWLVTDLFQRASVNMFMGPPKGGKSTLMRHLALCVAYGLPFLGRFPTKAAPVLYYSLQENKPHLRRWLMEALAGAKITKPGEVPAAVPIDFVFRLGHRGARAVKGTLQRINDRHYGLVLIDMWGRFSGVESLDDYAENEAITDALNNVAQETNVCVIWSHHERKSGGGSDSFAGAIGSQAIRGAVYTTLKAWKDKGRYYIATEQRDGDDLSPVAVSLEKGTQVMRTIGNLLAMSLSDALEREKNIEALLIEDPSIEISDIVEQLGGTTKEVGLVVDRLKQSKKLP